MENIKRTFTDMKIHFKSGDKTINVRYSDFLEILEIRLHPMRFYCLKDADCVIWAAIDINDILFIEPVVPNQ